MRWSLVLVAVVALSACSVALKKGARNIRTLPGRDVAKHCDYLGTFKATKTSAVRDAQYALQMAMKSVLNKSLATEPTHILWAKLETGLMATSSAIGEAYDCPDDGYIERWVVAQRIKMETNCFNREIRFERRVISRTGQVEYTGTACGRRFVCKTTLQEATCRFIGGPDERGE